MESEDYGLTHAERMRMEGKCVGCEEIPDVALYTEWQRKVWELYGWCAVCAATLDELNEIPPEKRASA